jgi:PHD/YefM family antitoxin component YafN of YafNO toxin-antitoxin module
MTSDETWAADKLAETLERIRLQLLAHVAAIARALEQCARPR